MSARADLERLLLSLSQEATKDHCTKGAVVHHAAGLSASKKDAVSMTTNAFMLKFELSPDTVTKGRLRKKVADVMETYAKRKKNLTQPGTLERMELFLLEPFTPPDAPQSAVVPSRSVSTSSAAAVPSHTVCTSSAAAVPSQTMSSAADESSPPIEQLAANPAPPTSIWPKKRDL